MNAVIIYDEVKLGMDATAILARSAQRADPTLPWTINPWRVDLFFHPTMADRVLREAVKAHLLVLAMRSQSEISCSLLDGTPRGSGRRTRGV
jgi:hypothetical protein